MKIKQTPNKCLRGQIAALRGTRNPHVQLRTFRFLRSVHLALYPARSLISHVFKKVAVVVMSASLLFCELANADGVSTLKDFFKQNNTLRAKFHQVVSDSQGRKAQEVDGFMQLKRPNQFRWDYQKPYEQQIVSDGKKVFLYDTELQQVTVRELSKAVGSSPAALLAGGSEVEKSFTLKNIDRNDDLTWVQAQPKDKDSGFESVVLGFKNDSIAKMEMTDSFGNITRIDFNTVERNPNLPTANFLFTPPKGVDVVGE